MTLYRIVVKWKNQATPETVVTTSDETRAHRTLENYQRDRHVDRAWLEKADAPTPEEPAP